MFSLMSEDLEHAAGLLFLPLASLGEGIAAPEPHWLALANCRASMQNA